MGKFIYQDNVSSEQEKQKVLDVVNSVKDVKGIDDQLQVKATDDTENKSMDNGDGYNDVNDDSTNQSDTGTNNSNDGSMQIKPYLS